MDYRQQVLEGFQEQFGYAPQGAYFAPGRVNLIGEHIDYLGGRVLPAAISLGTYAAASLRDDRKVRLVSLNVRRDNTKCFELDDIAYRMENGWANLLMGVFYSILERGYKIERGFDILYYGDLPNSAGLSSSASIQSLTAFLIRDLLGLEFDDVELARIVQASENDFVGVKTGIMDQFSVVMGRQDKAIYLNTDTLNYDYVNADLGEYRILILNTNVKRSLAGSAYNERRAQCEEALRQMNQIKKAKQLCDYSVTDFLRIGNFVDDDTVYKRAYHAIMENNRTRKAKEALEVGDLLFFGELLYGSHESLRCLYEVTVRELDVLVEFCRKSRACIGARMTGAGFGGCAIALVRSDQIDSFTEEITAYYRNETGTELSVYVAEISDGVKKL